MQNETYWENREPVNDSRTRIWIALFLFVSLAACVSAAIFIPGGLGFLAGYQELQSQNHEAAIVHFNRGLGYLAENYPELARTEFGISLKYDPAYEPAQQKLREMQAVAIGTPSAQNNSVADTLFNEASNFVTQKQWSDAITRLEQLKALQSDYRTTEVSDLLFQSYSNGGKTAVSAGQIELARERFDAALTIRNDSDIARQRDLAVLYLDGQQAVGYNWQVAIQKFSTLYQQDPSYDDVKKRLFDAYSTYGDLASKQSSPCLAVKEYDGALALMNDPVVAQKRAQTMNQCKQAISATPTPAGVAATENLIWKISTATDKTCGGVGDITGTVRDALGRGLANVAVGYYADGIPLVGTRTNANGQYQFVLGKDPGLMHVVILGTDGKTPVTLEADAQYPGGNNSNCHVVVDWQKVQ